jgi:DNA-binding XRE family transcriptional regulator
MISWTVETLNGRVDAEPDALPVDLRDRFIRIARLLEEFGPLHVREPFVKPLVGKLWEMRLKGKDGIARHALSRGQRAPAGGRSCLRQEDAEDTTECPQYGDTPGQGGRIAMTRLTDLHDRWLDEPAYQAAHAASEGEFTLARELIAARVRAGLTQEQLAQRMGTTQSVIARLESGRRMPGVRTLERLAQATGTRLVVRFERTGGEFGAVSP